MAERTPEAVEATRPSASKSPSGDGSIGCAIGCLTLIALIFIVSGVGECVRKRKVNPLRKEFAPLVSTAQMSLPADPRDTPYLRGKLVVFETPNPQDMLVLGASALRLSPVHAEIPEEWQANSRNEVSTIVRLEWGRHQVGQAKGVPFWTYWCVVVVIDNVKKEVVGRHKVWNEPKLKGSESYTTSVDVVRYLESLPWRNDTASDGPD